jgi:hypothetical protein
MSLIDTYNEMTKEAQVDSVVNERIEILEKYAAAAENMLENEYGQDYSAQDVHDLTTAIIDHDLAVEAEQEKVAELDEAGRVMARAFIDEAYR